jgi:UDP-N-acetylmuramoyl-L-alanyl-D-glutamate--2,6-diaminopimelate ligase
MNNFRHTVKKFIPKRVFTALQPPYHYALAYIGAIKFGHPSREITVIGITGTKGKSTTTEILAHILRGAGYKTASLSTIQFTYGEMQERNLFKMTMPGMFFVQRFLRKAVDAGCTHAVVEMTSEGAKQFRHKFIEIDALLFTNLTPEHIESHGSFANYKAAKLRLAEAVANSSKRPRTLIANVDDEHGQDFLNYEVEHILPYRLNNLTLHSLQKDSVTMVIDNVTIRVPIVGVFNVYNTLAAITYARSIDITLESIRESLAKLPPVAGRVEQFHSPAGAIKKNTVVVDYAHTPDSLTQLYEAFAGKHIIGVLGNTGGGRDTWKRPEMGAIAEAHCAQVILTNEDPYDENPVQIVEAMKNGMSPEASVRIIMDRWTAIKTAIDDCPADGYVLISGKGTDPYIMGPNGTKQVWSDAQVVQELLGYPVY